MEGRFTGPYVKSFYLTRVDLNSSPLQGCLTCPPHFVPNLKNTVRQQGTSTYKLCSDSMPL
jgi:hypothetical protein